VEVSLNRWGELNEFYATLVTLRERLGGCRRLRDSSGESSWPRRGVYFFFEDEEYRAGLKELRVVRVGTHAVTVNSRSTLWGRLRAHKGSVVGEYAGGGNHRGSIFRLHVGGSIISMKGLQNQYPKWGIGASAPKQVRLGEQPVEELVSQKIGNMPFLWLRVEDEPSPESERVKIERNSIALLSNFGRDSREVVDPPSTGWLGNWSINNYIRGSGLWNVNYVTDRNVDGDFLELLEKRLAKLLNDERIYRYRVRVKAIGNPDLLPESIRKLLNDIEEKTAGFDEHYLNIAVAYGGRAEITDMVRSIAKDVEEGRLRPSSITQETIEKRLYTSHLPNPEPELIIRTSG
jgi:hypothetical protein